MTELLKIYFISPDIKTCYFYRNVSVGSEKKFLKINHGKDFSEVIFGSLSSQALPEVPEECIGVSSLFAQRIGLKENEQALISNCCPVSIERVEVHPKKEEDYIILLSCKTFIETHFLNQVLLVAEGQTIPLHVFSNIIVDIQIGKFQPKAECGKLEKFTEVLILHESEEIVKPKTLNEFPAVKGNDVLMEKSHNIIPDINSLLKFTSFKSCPDKNCFIINKPCESEQYDCIVWSSFLVNKDISKEIVDNFIVIPFSASVDKSFQNGSMHCKIKVKNVNKYCDSNKEDCCEENNFGSCHIQVIYKPNICINVNLNKKCKTVAICPDSVLKFLNIQVGSIIQIEKIKSSSTQNSNFLTCSCEITDDKREVFWESLEKIKKNSIEYVKKNIIFNCRINTLIVGHPGAGKTVLLHALKRTFSENFIFCQFMYCKRQRGKKVESLFKLWYEALLECSRHEPSLFIVDDLGALTMIDQDEGESNKLYSERICDMIIKLVKDFQTNFNISMIASTVSLSQLESIVTTRGPRMFQNIQIIPEMSSSEQIFVLEEIISIRTKNIEKDVLNLNNFQSNLYGFNFLDLSDFIDRAIFKYFTLSESKVEGLTFNQLILESTLQEFVPAFMRGVNLRENIENKWDDVGGMTQPKTVLIELFSWPTKYPELLRSCPLKLQRGVLLFGAPGTGKTLLAGALANKCGLKFITVKGPEILSKYVGASEEGVRNLFSQAEKVKPCLIFFDEFDSLAPKRGHDSTGVTDRVVNQLLTQLDGVENRDGVWVIAATSRPDLLDPALLRPGRLDKLILCPVPDKLDRLSILKALSQKLLFHEDVDFSKVVENTNGYTGADLQAILYNAQVGAIKESKNLGSESTIKIKQKHLLDAISETKPSLSESEKSKYEKIYEKFRNSRKKNSRESNFGLVQKVTLA